MATQHANLSRTATVNLTTTLSLSDGTSYLVQALGGHYARLREDTTTPALDAPAYILHPHETWTIVQGSDDIYAWGDCRLVITEAS